LHKKDLCLAIETSRSYVINLISSGH